MKNIKTKIFLEADAALKQEIDNELEVEDPENAEEIILNNIDEDSEWNYQIMLLRKSLLRL